MRESELRTAVLDALTEIAPEIDASQIAWDEELRDQIDIDSMDLLNLMIGLHERTGVDIPESDYPKLATLDALLRYLGERIE